MGRGARSRNHPAFDLATALERARQLYEKDGKAPVASDVAVQAWGYGGLNGKSLRVLGAVRQFGLLDQAPNHSVKLSPRALTLLLEPADSPERAEALKAAFGEPTVYREITEQFPDGLPSEATLISHLVRNAGFSEDAAKNVNATYRASLDLVQRASAANIPPGAQASGVPSRGGQPSKEAPPAAKPASTASEGFMEFRWPVSDGAVVIVAFEKAPVAKDIDTLGEYLKIVKKQFGGAADTAANGEKGE